MALNQILVELQDVFGSDRVIAESAWTSSLDHSKKNLRSDEDVARVVRLLGNSKPAHGVPFESVIFRFWLRLPLISDRQYATHRIQAINGQSGRYRTMPSDFYSLPDDVLAILGRFNDCSIDDCSLIAEQYDDLCTKANEWYVRRVNSLKRLFKEERLTNEEFKRVRESLRGVLPQANMLERTATINLRSFANFVKQRGDSHAALEMQYIAGLMLTEVKQSGRIPIALEVLEANKWEI